ncbi:MAG: lipocalin-like domain-containing protein [bacterium]|nr:lipocalin-like domain-containing protein [bacterium]
MVKYGLLGLLVLAVVLTGFSLIDGGSGEISAIASLGVGSPNSDGYARAIDPYTWQFPRDFGSHDQFQTEWWYYTGNLADENGRRFGFQFTIFRRAITPDVTTTNSEWRTSQVYMAHFTVSDIEGAQFFHDERYGRGSADLAGALPNNANPNAMYRVWIEDWEVSATDESHQTTRISAKSDQFAVDFTLQQVKSPALQGDNGLSKKSSDEGNASYYYTLSRLVTEGTITINGESYTVSGNTWKDHEFSTSALGAGAQGWDWFGLIFDGDYELMVGKIRMEDGGREPAFGGLLIYPDGTTRYLSAEEFTITPTDTWRSPHTDAEYPSGWTITLIGAIFDNNQPRTFTVTPLAKDQELHSGDIAYWEGAVKIDGDFTGYGYAELTGYVNTMNGRF